MTKRKVRVSRPVDGLVRCVKSHSGCLSHCDHANLHSADIEHPLACQHTGPAPYGQPSIVWCVAPNARPVRTAGPPRDSGTHEAVVGGYGS